jgi:hypothetical protein
MRNDSHLPPDAKARREMLRKHQASKAKQDARDEEKTETEKKPRTNKQP